MDLVVQLHIYIIIRLTACTLCRADVDLVVQLYIFNNSTNYMYTEQDCCGSGCTAVYIYNNPTNYMYTV